MISKILGIFISIEIVNGQCQMQQPPVMCQQQFVECVPAIKVERKKQNEEAFVDPWALEPDEIIDYDLLPPESFTALYDNGGFSPGCPGGTTEDECIRMLGCSWCPWNNLGCVYKDVADLLPIPYIEGESGGDFCYSANEISGEGEPQDYHWFWFYYGRFYPPVVTRQ